MSYLLKRNNTYYYNRNIPTIYRDLDPRKNVRISLGTACKRTALRKSLALDDAVEDYWQSLLTDSQSHDLERFGKIVHTARQMGFAYKPITEIAALPMQELLERILALQSASEKQVKAVLGGKEASSISLSQALEKYWQLSQDLVFNKSESQIRKWRNPRIKALNSFIAIVGDKPLKEITKSDITDFREWWVKRVNNENKDPDSANKDFIHLKGILELVSDHESIGLDISHLFKKIKLKKAIKQTRLPFTSEQIVSLVNNPKLSEMGSDGRNLLMIVAETGARPSEIIGLLSEDIVLNDAIPHICIRNRKDKMLKTPHSERTIPLVGYALEAFRNCPNGFLKYRNKPDNLTNAISKFLRDHRLTPSKQHTVYSLRHSFQDRILSVNAPDRVQAELMGHKFNRPKYGNGASLEQKRDWLNKIRLTT